MLTFLMLAGCADPGAVEAQAALDEAIAASKAESVLTRVVHLTTSSTLGERFAANAEERRAFLRSQLPCSHVYVEGDVLVIDFGTLDDNCVWEGETWAGRLEVRYTDRGDDRVDVEHAWLDFGNGEYVLNGHTNVHWTGEAAPARVVTNYTELSDGRVLRSGSDVQMTPLGPGEVGVELDGWREWSRELDGEFLSAARLDILDIEIRGIDPVPQAGTWLFRNDSGWTYTMEFQRFDVDTIQVTITWGDDNVRVVYVTSEEQGPGGIAG